MYTRIVLPSSITHTPTLQYLQILKSADIHPVIWKSTFCTNSHKMFGTMRITDCLHVYICEFARQTCVEHIYRTNMLRNSKLKGFEIFKHKQCSKQEMENWRKQMFHFTIHRFALPISGRSFYGSVFWQGCN